MKHSTICAIMHLFVTYQKKFCQLYPVLLMPKSHLLLNKTDDYFYMVTFQIGKFGRNICNRLTPFMDIVYFVCLLLQNILLDITPRNINYISQSSLCKLLILFMSNLQIIVIVYGVVLNDIVWLTS